MKVVILGGGPAGLYSAILLKKARPTADITVVERNPAGATYGWGVVFSDRTLAAFQEADHKTYTAITDSFVIWDAIDIHYRDVRVRCGGHVIAGIARKRLLSVLQERCAELGVTLRFDCDVRDLAELGAYDLLIGADGLNGLVRKTSEAQLGARVTVGAAKYIWLGTDKLLDCFTFLFRENEHGLFQVHAYPFSGDRSTFIVECAEEVWRKAGLDVADEAASIAYCERLFADELQGSRLLPNNSRWISFPTLKTARWHYQNVALLGDAIHTAHFSIGSGTKLAMEDAIALANALDQYPDIERALTEFELERRPAVEALQQAASESQTYFERIQRYLGLDPLKFAFQLLARSGRITYDDLRLRDPRFGELVDRWFASGSLKPLNGNGGRQEANTAPRDFPAVTPPPAFTPLRLASLDLANRIALLPEHGSESLDGSPDDNAIWTGARGPQGSGVGLLLTEPLAVAPEGLVTPDSQGAYTAAHAAAWRRSVEQSHATSTRVCAVLNHAGRRGATRPLRDARLDQPLREGAWPLLAPSPLAYSPASQTPRAMTEEDMTAAREAFVSAARLALDADFDLLLLHMAHGYLLASFLSPLANQRADGYGGALANRMRYPLGVFEALRAVWPVEKPLGVVLLADDCAPGGWTLDDAVAMAVALKARGCDLIQPLAGHTTPSAIPAYGRGFLTRASDRIRNEAGVATLVGGHLTTMNEINTVLAAGRADLCMLEPLREKRGDAWRLG